MREGGEWESGEAAGTCNVAGWVRMRLGAVTVTVRSPCVCVCVCVCGADDSQEQRPPLSSPTLRRRLPLAAVHTALRAGALLVHCCDHPSIIHHPSSIIHHPSSIIHHPSSHHHCHCCHCHCHCHCHMPHCHPLLSSHDTALISPAPSPAVSSPTSARLSSPTLPHCTPDPPQQYCPASTSVAAMTRRAAASPPLQPSPSPQPLV